VFSVSETPTGGLQQRVRVRGAQRLYTGRSEKRGGPAVEDGLGGGDRRHDVGVDESRVDAKRDSARALELDEVGALGVVHLYAPVETAGEGRRDERLQLAVAGSARESSGHEECLALEGDSRLGQLFHRGRDRAAAGVERRAGNRQRRGLDDDRRVAAARHDRLERLSGERKAQRVADGGRHVGDRLDRRRRSDDDAVLAGVDERELRAGEERDAWHYSFSAYPRA
jgi:hypothetical protein